MADIIEIIIKAVDEAGQVFDKIGNEATEMAHEVDSALENVDFDEMGNEAQKAGNEINHINTNGLNKVGHEVQEEKSKFSQLKETVRNTFNSAKEYVSRFGNTLNNLGGKVTEVKSKFTNLKNSINYAGAGASSASASFGFLRNAASMTVGMIGYDLFNAFMESGRSAINARVQFDYFSGRLGLTGTKLSNFKTEVANLQQEFRKVDMTAVAATSEEIAVKQGLAADKVSELTRLTAVMSSTFVKEGRTQEDSILAVSDALDGQFKRLQEIGITREDIINDGWSGDLNDQIGLIEHLNSVMTKKGYEQTAKDITSLDDAFTALSITGGQLLADILIPMTPVLISIMGGVMTVADGIRSAITTVQSAFGSLPDWAQLAIGVTAFGIAAGVLGTILLAEVVPGMVGSTIATINWIATALGAEVSAITLSGAFGVLGAAIWTALAPLLPFIVAAALIVVAIFEIGKAFGWWSDVGSMLSAIQAGLSRLWSAFINHPDVQSAIKAIGDALQALGKWVGWAGQEVLEFFGISSGGNWDVVSSIIHGVGDAWNFIKGILSTVTGAAQAAQNQFGTFGGFLAAMAAPILFVYGLLRSIVCILLGCSPGIVPALQTVQSVFGAVWSGIVGIISPIVAVIINTLNSLITIFDAVKSGKISLGTAIVSVLQLLLNAYSTILKYIANLVLQFARKIASYAIQAGKNFVNNIVNRVNKLPGRFLSYLTRTSQYILNQGNKWVATARAKASLLVSNALNQMSKLPGRALGVLYNVVSSIASAGSQWVSSGISYASQLVSSVVDQISSLPDSIMNEFSKIPDRINSAVSSAASAASSFGSGIKNAVLRALHIASPGIVQKKIKAEFWDTVDRIKETIRPAYDAGRSYGESILNGFNSVDLSRDNILDPSEFNTAIDVDGNSFEITTGQYYEVDDNLEVTVKQEHEFVFSFKDVPPWIDTDKIVSLMKDAIKDKTLIRELVNNPDFQKLDAEVKDRILRKVKRSRGV